MTHTLGKLAESSDGTASPYDGNLLYWSTRLRKHPLLSSTKARLLQKQQGKCRWCELLFQDGDAIEIDHLTPKNRGGGEELSNKLALHRHCHDARHAKCDLGTFDKGSVLEEPYEVKVSRTVCAVRRFEISLSQTGRTREVFLSHQLTQRRKPNGTRACW